MYIILSDKMFTDKELHQIFLKKKHIGVEWQQSHFQTYSVGHIKSLKVPISAYL